MTAERNLRSAISRREFLRLSALAAAAGLLANCSRGTAVPSGEEGGEEVPEIVELTYMLPDRELSKIQANYNIETFNAKMEQEGKPWRMKLAVGPATDNDYQAKLATDGAAKTLSDVVDIHGTWLADMAAAGYIMDITDLLQSWDGWDHFFPVVKELSRYGNSWYSVHGGTSVYNIFYRRDILEAAGIPTDQPKTWDDYYDLCEQIATKTDAWPSGFPAGQQWGGGSWDEGFKYVWLSYCDNQDQICELSTGKWVIKSDQLLSAFKVYETLAVNGWLTVEMLLTPNPWEPIKYDGFPKGKVLTVTGGTHQWTFDWGPDGATPIEGLFEKVDTWLWPSYDGKPFAYAGLGWGTTIAANTKSAEGAFEFVKHMLSPETQCGAMEVAEYPGPVSRDDVIDQCEYLRTAVQGKMAEATETLEVGRSIKQMPGESKIADSIARATEALITGRVSAEEALEMHYKQALESLGEELTKTL